MEDAAASDVTDTVASVTFAVATKGVSFGYNPATSGFGGLSVAGQNGAFIAAVNGDIGSPGTIASAPIVTGLDYAIGSGFSLSFATVPNLKYRMEYNGNLTDPNWTALTNFTATASQHDFTDTAASTNAAGFYRVSVTP